MLPLLPGWDPPRCMAHTPLHNNKVHLLVHLWGTLQHSHLHMMHNLPRWGCHNINKGIHEKERELLWWLVHYSLFERCIHKRRSHLYWLWYLASKGEIERHVCKGEPQFELQLDICFKYNLSVWLYPTHHSFTQF